MIASNTAEHKLSVSDDPVSSDDGCPAWFWRNNSSDVCQCESLIGGVILCDQVNQVALIVTGYCMSWDTSTNDLVVGYNNYRYIGNKMNTNYTEVHRVYSVLPRNVSARDNAFCTYENQEGFLCGECVKDHGLAFNSLHSECVECKGYIVPAMVFLFLMTVFFVLVVVLKLNFTSGPLLWYITFSQVFVMCIKSDVGFYDSLHAGLSPFGRAALIFSLRMSGLWWYFTTILFAFPKTCINQNMSGLQVVSFEYILVLHPLLLVLVTYAGIELHAHNCRLVVFLWKPLNKLFAKLRKNLSANDSIIHAYATFFFLSFWILTYISFNLLHSTKVYNRYGEVTKSVLVCDPRVETFSHKHLPYAITGILLFYLLGVVPTLLLCLYPTRACTKCSRLASVRMRLNLKIFVETFQGCLRDGVDGGCDFRFLSGAPMLLALILTSLSMFKTGKSSINASMPTCLLCPVLIVVLSVVAAYVKPYKSRLMNLSMIFHLGVMGLMTGVILLWYDECWFIDTHFLASTFTLLAVLPHVVALIAIIVWIFRQIHCLRVTFKKMSKRMSGAFQGGRDGTSESLPHRLINSSMYNTFNDF